MSSETESVALQDAAIVVLLRDPEHPQVLIARRNFKQRFLGGYHAFAGGRLDPQDRAVEIRGASGEEALFRAVALRELLEETGVLIGAESDPALRRRLRAGLLESRPLAELLQAEGLTLSAAPLVRCGRWVTPPFSPRRYHTWVFLAWLPADQDVEVTGELEEPAWQTAAEILERWERSEILLAPPTLLTLRALAEGVDDAAERLERLTTAHGRPILKLPFRPDLMLFPQRTPTRPPATHTNAYLLGRRRLLVVDPGSTSLEELEPLAEEIQNRLSNGAELEAVLVTHHHPDHCGGVGLLAQRFGAKVAAHPETARRLEGRFPIEQTLAGGELLDLGDSRWEALHTPGHAPGHLCLRNTGTGDLLSGDLIAGAGSVMIDPQEGDMEAYLAALERLAALELRVLFPAHGPPVASAQRQVQAYLRHRRWRESRILSVLGAQPITLAQIVQAAYDDVDPQLHDLAERTTLAHLIKLQREGAILHEGSSFRVARDAR